MKSTYLRASAVLACALALSACGGSDGELGIGGSFAGVTKSGLVLTNNGGSDLAITPTADGRGTFFFKDLVETDSTYNVKVKSIPSNAVKCEEFNNTGRAAFTINNIGIVCTIKQHALTGKITGLTGANLVLVNGADRVPVPAGATSFAMAPVSEDSPYGVVVLTQPDNQTCTVTNGSGTMGENDVNSLAVTCGPRA